MNNKESELYRILDNVIECCTFDIPGIKPISRDDVLGKSKSENIVMTRSILVHQLISAGYSTTTVSYLLNRTTRAIRHLVESHILYEQSSRAYRIADAQATLKCKELGIN